MPPPHLAADAPILQAGHPVVIDLRPAVGVKFHLAIGDDGLAFLHARVFEEPLLAQAALDGHVGTLGVAEIVLIRLLFDEATDFREQLGSAFAGGEALHACEVFACEVIEHAVRLHHIDGLQLVTLGDLKVCLIMSRRDLQHASAKGEINVFVADNWQQHLVLDG